MHDPIVDGRAEQVDRHEVRLLDGGRRWRVDAEQIGAGVAERARSRPGQGPRLHVELAGGAGRGDDVLALARRAQREQDVALAAVGPYLAREALAGAVVVGDRRQARRVRVQRDRAQGTALVAVAADELGGQVLGLRGAAAVAGHEQASSAKQDGRELVAPALDTRQLALEQAERAAQRAQVAAGIGPELLDRVNRPATPAIAAPTARRSSKLS